MTVLLETDQDMYNKEHEKLLLDEFKHKFGNDLKASIRIVDTIPRERSGKFRMIINNCDKG